MIPNQRHQATRVPGTADLLLGRHHPKGHQSFAMGQIKVLLRDPACVSKGSDEPSMSLELACGRQSTKPPKVNMFPDEGTKRGVPVSANPATVDKIC